MQGSADGTTIDLDRYDVATATWTAVPTTAVAGASFVAAGYDQATGIYYYAAYADTAGKRTATLYGYDVARAAPLPDAVATIALRPDTSKAAHGAIRDLSFDRHGNLYLVDPTNSRNERRGVRRGTAPGPRRDLIRA